MERVLLSYYPLESYFLLSRTGYMAFALQNYEINFE